MEKGTVSSPLWLGNIPTQIMGKALVIRLPPALVQVGGSCITGCEACARDKIHWFNALVVPAKGETYYIHV